MSKIEDTNVFSSANATIDPVAPKDCIFGSGVKINYDSTLPCFRLCVCFCTFYRDYRLATSQLDSSCLLN